VLEAVRYEKEEIDNVAFSMFSKALCIWPFIPYLVAERSL